MGEGRGEDGFGGEQMNTSFQNRVRGL
jgi:hypothetical protein